MDLDAIPPLPPPDEAPMLPVSPALSYSSRSTYNPRSNRPGSMSAIGVFSLLLGLIGVIINGASMWQVMAMPTIAATLSAAAKAQMAPSLKILPYDGDLIGTRGLKQADRNAIAIALEQASGQRLAPDRRIMLDRLLGEYGRAVFPNTSGPLTPQAVRAELLESGRLPAGPDGLGTLGTDYFRTAAGTAWVNDASANFRTAVDSGPAGRFVVRQEAATDDKGQTARSAVVVADQLERLHAKLGDAFNSIQASVVAGELTWKGAPSPPPAWAVGTSATPLDDDARISMAGPAVQYDVTASRVWVLADGRTILNPVNIDAATGLPLPPPGAPPPITFTRATKAWSVVDVSVSLVVAIILAALGVMMMADHRAATRLHIGYAWLKLTAVCVAAIAMYRVLSDLYEIRNLALPEYTAVAFALVIAVRQSIRC